MRHNSGGEGRRGGGGDRGLKRKKKRALEQPPDADIASVQFTPASRDEVRKCIAAVEITNPISNVVFEMNNSMHDTRMGAFKNVLCGTCQKGEKECGGHAGYIALSAPCLNSVFLKTIMKQILAIFCFRCFCRECKCGVGDDPSDPTAAAAAAAAAAGVSKRKRVKMVHVNPSQALRRQRGVKVRFEWADSEDKIETSKLYELISKIPREEYLPVFPYAQTFTDLTDGVFVHNLVVLPTSTRPPNFCNGEWRAEHITRLYLQVLKKSLQLRMKVNAKVAPHLIEEYHNELQSAVDVLFDVNNSNSNLRNHVVQNGGIRQRIDGKQGRLRLNLMGKRVNFSARTVLSGDPRLGLNEVGVPRSVATNLTVPVRVTPHNLGEISRYNLRYVVKNGQRFDAQIMSGAIKIEVGDIVERSLIDGDIVAVNRQPTLHRGSTLACRIRIFESKTFRMNYSSLITMNGDCDGDEINLHVPQDLESRAELETLMMTSTNIVCSQASQPLIGCTQDSLLGCYLLSKAFVDERDLMAILYEMGLDASDKDLDTPCVCTPTQRLFSGNRILSKALEAVGVLLRRYNPNQNFLMINNEVVFGAMDKAIVGTADDSVIHHIYLQKGHAPAGRFIHLMQKAATAFLDMRGFSVGISDCVVDAHEKPNFDALDDYLWEDFMQRKGKWTERDEATLCDALAELTKLAPPDDTSVNSSAQEDNRLLTMIQSGAKGNLSNYNQITRVVGQQIEETGRVSARFTHGTRTLPHFSQFDRSTAARGLVKSSFIDGLAPHEMFFHAMGGRIGIIDTACKTSVTGAQYRRLVKSLEPLTVKDMGAGEMAVMNTTTQQVVQMQYGEDSIDGTYLKRRKLTRDVVSDANAQLQLQLK